MYSIEVRTSQLPHIHNINVHSIGICVCATSIEIESKSDTHIKRNRARNEWTIVPRCADANETGLVKVYTHTRRAVRRPRHATHGDLYTRNTYTYTQNSVHSRAPHTCTSPAGIDCADSRPRCLAYCVRRTCVRVCVCGRRAHRAKWKGKGIARDWFRTCAWLSMRRVRTGNATSATSQRLFKSCARWAARHEKRMEMHAARV